MQHFFEDKRVLVTGACGTVGRELVRQLLVTYRVGELVGVDINDTALLYLEHAYAGSSNAAFFITDVRNRDELSRRVNGVDVIFHAAALKHVILCERAPAEAIHTNIHGTQNVIEAAMDRGVKHVVFTSSDKAVNPTSILGSTKLTAERLMTAAAAAAHLTNGPVFVSTRFGNVLGSRGSVIPIFHDQVRRGGPMTLTDARMTRFIMSLEEAIRLVIESLSYARGGEVMVTKMPVIRIADLAQVMRDELAPRYGHAPQDIEIATVGAKPGEKLYEELMTTEETRRTLQLERYFVILPALGKSKDEVAHAYGDVVSTTVPRPYTSDAEPALTRAELRDFLLRYGLLSETPESGEQPCEAPAHELMAGRIAATVAG